MKINGEVVRALREQRSWSQEHLASATGLSVRTVQRVEAEDVASAETRLALAAAFDVPVADLMLTPRSPDAPAIGPRHSPSVADSPFGALASTIMRKTILALGAIFVFAVAALVLLSAFSGFIPRS